MFMSYVILNKKKLELHINISCKLAWSSYISFICRLCLVGLAPEHEIIAMKKKVTKVSYDKVYSGDMQNLVKGKKKSKKTKT